MKFEQSCSVSVTSSSIHLSLVVSLFCLVVCFVFLFVYLFVLFVCLVAPLEELAARQQFSDHYDALASLEGIDKPQHRKEQLGQEVPKLT